MDTVINVRCDLLSNLINEREIYMLCGVDPLEQIIDIANMMIKDLQNHTTIKHKDIRLLAFLIKRRSTLRDWEGLKWCVNQIVGTLRQNHVCHAYKMHIRRP